MLASGQRIPSGIAIDATSVYWVNEGEPNEGKGSGFFDGQLLACSKTGCGNAPTALASGLELTAIDRWLVPVAVAGGSVYWVASQKVLRCLTTGCNGNPTALWTGQQSAQSFALDTSNLYVALVTGPDQGSGEIAQCPLSGCGLTPLTLASSAVPFGIAVDAKNVYWIDSQARVLACAIGGCSGAPTVLVAGPAYAPIVASGSRLYWTNGASPVAGCAAGCSDAGAPLTTTTGSKAGGLAIDATNAYWTQPVDGLVLKCPLSGCATPTIVASGESGPAAIAVDDTNVYWTDSGSRGTDGMIRTAPK